MVMLRSQDKELSSRRFICPNCLHTQHMGLSTLVISVKFICFINVNLGINNKFGLPGVVKLIITFAF